MVVHSYYPYDETRVQRQAEALVEAGHHVDVICLRYGREPALETVAGVKVHRLPIQRNKKRGAWGQLSEYLGFLVLAFIRLTRLDLRQPFDVVQVHNLPDLLVFAALIPRLRGSRIILDLHDLMPEFYASKFDRDMASWAVRLIGWQEQLSCRFAHHVITVSEPWRQLLARRGIAPEKCTVVMNLADPRYFSRRTAYDDLQTAETIRLIYHGSITRRYGVDLILQALARVRQDIPAVHLTLQGRGDYLDAVLELIESLQLSDHVSVRTEFLPAPELAQLIASHHVGIVPYRRDVFTDGILPTKLMEYMALGMPAIVARTPGINAYFDDSMVEYFDAEHVPDLAEHILRLSQDRTRLVQLARNTARFNEQYNWFSEREKYIQLVERLAERNSVSSHRSVPYASQSCE